MIERYPLLFKFNRLYWHQTGIDLYSSVENAFLIYLKDASGLPDGGKTYRNQLRKELREILQDPEYKTWSENAIFDSAEIIKAGGNIIPPDKLPIMQRMLNSEN